MSAGQFQLSHRLLACISGIFLTVAFCLPPILLAGQDPESVQAAASPGKDTMAAVPLGPAAAALSPEELGDLYMVRKRYQAALAAYRTVPHPSAGVWNKLGIAEQQLFLMADAKKSYEISLKMDNKNPDVLNNLATVHYSMQEYGQAEKLYKKALKLKPRSALIYKNLGTDLLAANKFKKGWDCYQTALSIDPNIFEKPNLLRIGEPTPTQKRGAMSYYLAKSYVMVGMNDLAVEYLRRAIDEGFTDRKKILADKEFASLYEVTSFQELLAEQQQRRP